MRRLLLGSALAALASSSSAQIAPTLLGDIDTEPAGFGPVDSYPEIKGALGNGLLLRASDGYLDEGLWFADRTTGDAHQLTIEAAGTPIATATLPSGVAVFSTNTGIEEGMELWVTDGTTVGTQLLIELSPGGEHSIVSGPIEWQGVAWFMGNTPANGAELWTTDGTPEGTSLYHEFEPGPDGAGYAYFHEAGGQLFVSTRVFGLSRLFAIPSVGVAPIELAVLAGGPSPPLVEHALEFQGELWFAADDGVTGTELWRSNGTASGTTQVVDIEPGAASSDPEPIAADANRLWFKASRADVGAELWMSDGTTTGTDLVEDIRPGPDDGLGLAWGAVVPGGELVFRAEETFINDELFVSDGTSAGTEILLDIYPGIIGSSPGPFIELGGSVYFAAATPGDSRELWATDGTALGTVQVADINPTGTSGPYGFVEVDQRIWFRADDGVNGHELWASDGLGGTTEMMSDIAPELVSEGSIPTRFLQALDKLVFLARSDAGNELWITDGTPQGTEMVLDLVPGPTGSDPYPGVALGDRILFSAEDPTWGDELWITDGTAAGTSLVADLEPGTESSHPHNFLQLGNGAIFVAWTGDDKHLFFTDGSGVHQLTDPGEDYEFSSESGAVLGGIAYLAISGPGNEGRELWRTDGTSGGTQILVDIAPGAASSFPYELVPIGDALLFRAEDGVNGEEIWITDGTELGTTMVSDIAPGFLGSAPRDLTPLGNKVVFRAFRQGFGVEPWVSDGTEVGTLLLGDLVPGNDFAGSSPDNFARIDDLVYFTARIEEGGPEVGYWTTDGTPAGTIHHPELGNPGLRMSLFRDLGGDGAVLFRGFTEATGYEPWTIPASGGPATPLAEVYPGPGSSTPMAFFELNGKVVFSGFTPVYGTEPYAIDLVELGTFGSEPMGSGCSIGPFAASISSSGAASPGSVMNVEVTGALPGAGLWAFFALDLIALPFSGCYLHLGSPILIGATFADAEGSGSIPAGFPSDTSLVGLDLALQCLTGETGGPVLGQFGLSNALEIVVGP